METSTQTLADLIREFLDGGIGTGAFAARYQRQYSDEPPETAAFFVLDRLWIVCEEFYEDLSLREPGDTTDEELDAEAERAWRELGELKL